MGETSSGTGRSPDTCRHCGGYGPSVVKWDDGKWAHKTMNGCAAWFRDETRRLYHERATLTDKLSDALGEAEALRQQIQAARAEVWEEAAKMADAYQPHYLGGERREAEELAASDIAAALRQRKGDG